MAGIVQKRYAEALYKAAEQHKKTDLIADEIEIVRKAIFAQKEFMKILCHPKIDEENKIKIVKTIFDGKISQQLMGLIILTIKKKRQSILDKIFDEYIKIVKNRKNISTAIVTSAIELSHEYIQKIQEKLRKSLNREIEIETSIDKQVLGGLKIQVDNTVFDRTIKSKLEELKQAL